MITFAGELLQNDLISDAGHKAAIAVTTLSPANKVAHLVSEADNNVRNSPDTSTSSSLSWRAGMHNLPQH